MTDNAKQKPNSSEPSEELTGMVKELSSIAGLIQEGNHTQKQSKREELKNEISDKLKNLGNQKPHA
ncbi:hypothetical protein J2S78_002754 [Salibacterium salarium]|uniref:hypothetical protein n=1 Tax=Salibacterium salarium TaxID=284579 RepID=UPI002782CA77|nr:hypothetical protein [Salibacterium salarium]MDQ0300307.1 hypothetical protein [Salibacterium salarium]